MAVAVLLTLGLTLGTALTGCSSDTGGKAASALVPTRQAVNAPAPTPDQIVKDAVTAALKSSTARFTFTIRSSQKGYSSRSSGSGTVDLARGRLDHTQSNNSTLGNWQGRYLIVGSRVYVKNLSGAKKGFWYQAPVDQPGRTYTRDGFADPLEYLRALLTLDPGVEVLGDRTISGEDVVAYTGTARPARRLAASYDRPGRDPGQLAGNLRYLKVKQVAVRVYLDGQGRPMRIVLSGTGAATKGVRSTVSASLTTVGWGDPAPIRRPAFTVPTFDELYS